jgi:methyl-accepting chemotaxis protein
MDQSTQQNAAMVEESTAAVHALAKETDAMSEIMSTFDLGGRTADPLRTELKKAAPHAFRSPDGAHNTAARRAASSASVPIKDRVRKTAVNGGSEGWDEF